MRENFPWASASGVLLDLDGTVADTAAGIHAAGGRMLADLGLPPVSLERARGFIGNGMPRFVKRLLTGERWANPDPELFVRASEMMSLHYARECAVSPKLYPGARRTLDFLAAAGISLACVTNKPRRFTEPLLQACGLDSAFDAVVCGDDWENKKPHPEPLLRACAELGAPPEGTVMVGDSAATDLRAAEAAGCEFAGVSYGYGADPFPPGTFVMDSLEELTELMTMTTTNGAGKKERRTEDVAAA